MIATSRFSDRPATILHRVTGSIDQVEAEQGAVEALRLVQQLAVAHGPLNLVLDLRGKHFVSLQAHKTWSQGFARHPALQEHVRAVAIVGDDTPAFRAEQALMETEQVRFFADLLPATQWLAELSAQRDHPEPA